MNQKAGKRPTIFDDFNANVDLVAAFVAANGRWPKSKHVDEDELRVYRVYAQLRSGDHSRKIRSTPAYKDYLDRVTPGWGDSRPNERFAVLAGKLAAFRAQHDHWPSQTSSDPHEKRMGQWLSGLRTAIKKQPNPEREAYLDRVVPGWREADPYDSEHSRPMKRFDEVFKGNADSVSVILERTNRWPSIESDDPEERKLHRWLTIARHRNGRPELTAQRSEYLDRVIPGWRRPYRSAPNPDDVFNETADRVSMLLETTNRWPSMMSENPEVRKLAHWLDHVRHGRTARTAGRAEYLDRVIPGWRPSPRLPKRPDEVFKGKANRVSMFLERTNQWPLKKSGDPEERKLAAWLLNVRMRDRKPPLTPDRMEYLDKIIPGWRPSQRLPKRFDDVFRSKANRVYMFLELTNHWPSSKRSNPKEERQLAAWLTYMRRLDRLSTLAPDRMEYLDKIIPGWRLPPRTPVRFDDVFKSKVDGVSMVLERTNQWPSKQSGDPDERKLAAWFFTARVRDRKPQLAADRMEYMDKVIPGWRRRPVTPKQFDEVFRINADKVSMFLELTNRWPSSISRDSKEERKLAAWLTYARGLDRKNMLAADRMEYMDKVIPGWRRRPK